MPQQNGSGQRLIEQRQHWLFKGFDLGHLLTMLAMGVGVVWAASDLKTDIAVIKSRFDRVSEDVRSLQLDLRRLERRADIPGRSDFRDERP